MNLNYANNESIIFLKLFEKYISNCNLLCASINRALKIKSSDYTKLLTSLLNNNEITDLKIDIPDHCIDPQNYKLALVLYNKVDSSCLRKLQDYLNDILNNFGPKSILKQTKMYQKIQKALNGL